MLLIYYKDDPDKLAKIMEKLLDRQVHPLYKAPLLSSFYTNNPTPMGQSCSTSSRQMRQRRENVETGMAAMSLDHIQHSLADQSGNRSHLSHSGASVSGGFRDQSPTWEDDYAHWQASAQSDGSNGGSGASGGGSAANNRHLMMNAARNRSMAHRAQRQPGPGSDSGSSGSGKSSGSDSFGSRGPLNHPPPTVGAAGSVGLTDSERGAGASSSSLSGGPLNASLSSTMSRPPQQASIPETSGSLNGGSSSFNRNNGLGPCSSSKVNRFKNKRLYPSVPNQPSEASAHFMFELAKTVLLKAGGNSSTSLFTQPINSQNPRGPIRALQMCAFQIGLYALGLHNCVSAKWLSRTYSSHVSWITGI